MNRFSRIRHHVDMKDVKKRHLEETAAKKIKQKQIEEEKRLQKEIYDAWKSDWRKDMIGEGMTTTDMFQFLVKGEDGNLFTTGTGFTQDGTHQLQNIPPMNTVDDPHNVGTALGGGTIGAGYQSIYGGINQYDGPTQERDGIETNAWKNRAVHGSALDNNNNLRFSDYIYPFDREATEAEMQAGKDATKVLGQNDTFRAVYPTNVVADRHKIAPIPNPESLIGLNAYETIDGVTSYERCGLGIAYGGEYDSRTPRFFVPAAVDARHIDSIEVIGAIGGNNSPNSPLLLYYWSGDKPGFQSLQSVNAHPSVQYPPNKRQYDGWRPIAQKPNGEIDSSVSSTIMDLNNLPAGITPRHVGKFVVPIPEWCRSKNTRFMYLQLNGGASPRIFSIGYQRRNNAVVVAPLDDPKSSSFVRVGPGMDGKGAKERAKKVNDMLKASREYMLKSLGYASLFNDEVKISDVVSNDLDFFSVMQGSGAYGNSRFNDLVSLEKRQKAAGITRSQQTKTRSGRGFRGYRRTGRNSKGMTTRARVNPNDIIGSI